MSIKTNLSKDQGVCCNVIVQCYDVDFDVCCQAVTGSRLGHSPVSGGHGYPDIRSDKRTFGLSVRRIRFKLFIHPSVIYYLLFSP